MKRLAVLAFFLLCAMQGVVRADEDRDITWTEWDITGHLDNDGNFRVTERDTVFLNGSASVLERKFGVGTDQSIVLHRLAIVDADGTAHEFSAGDDRQKERYEWKDQRLTWRVKLDNDPDWRRQKLVFIFEYEMRNAVSPAWDIAPGRGSFAYRNLESSIFQRARETLANWREAGHEMPHRFRLDHDVLFVPFPATGPAEIHYIFQYDNAWKVLHPESDLGRVTPKEDYRVVRQFERVTNDWPPAIECWRPSARMLSIAAFGVAVLLLAVLLVVTETAKLGFGPPRIDEAWLNEHLVGERPEVLAWLVEARSFGAAFMSFLARLRDAGVLSLHSTPATPAADEDDERPLRLKLLRDPSGLQAYERRMLDVLFPRGPESGAEVLAQHYSKDGFDPGEQLRDALGKQFGESEAMRADGFAPWWARGVGYLACVLMLAGLVGAFYAMFRSEPGWRAMLPGLFAGFIFAIGPKIARPFLGALGGGLMALVVAAWASLGFAWFFSYQMETNLPISAEGSVALGVYWLGCTILLFLGARTLDAGPLGLRKRNAELAQLYAKRQLLRAHPALRDAWMPQLVALGLLPDIVHWSSAHANRDGSAPDAFRFTGSAPSVGDAQYSHSLHIFSAKDRDALAAEERDAKDDE